VNSPRLDELLAGAPGFGQLPGDVRHQLATLMVRRRFAAGDVLVRQGERGDRLFLIGAGRAEVSVDDVAVAGVQAGDLVGEQALLRPESERGATVTAVTETFAWELSGADFAANMAHHPEARESLIAMGRDMAVANFLAVATPLRALGPSDRRRLALALEEAEFRTGEVIVREGEPSDVAYLLMEGKAEAVSVDARGDSRRLGTLQPGALFGETGVLTGGPRSASVRALEPCRTVSLAAADLVDALAREPGAARDVSETMRLRSRPRRAPGVEVFERSGGGGEMITVLRDATRGAYFQLSNLGRFVWDRLDGEHNVRDLTLEYLDQRGRLAPLAIADLLTALVGAGFVDEPELLVGFAPVRRLSMRERAMAAAKRAIEWNTNIRETDRFVDSAYRRLRYAFTPVGGIAIGFICIAGLVAFIAATASAREYRIEAGWVLLLVVYPALIAAVIAHEVGHAVATKHYGRRVNRIGVGWYWFGPIAFVDTSDMWTAERGPRIAVSVAGPVASLMVAGLAGFAALTISIPLLAAAAWQVALITYIAVFVNLNPLLEFDGYYVLIDVLDRPNLRSDALRWLGNGLPAQWRDHTALRKHRLELAYGVAAVLFIVLGATLTVLIFRAVIRAWLEPLIGDTATAIIGVTVAAAALAVPFLALAGEIRGVRHPTAAGNR
jgi:putative peptide zinc metalloprotease protein